MDCIVFFNIRFCHLKNNARMDNIVGVNVRVINIINHYYYNRGNTSVNKYITLTLNKKKLN